MTPPNGADQDGALSIPSEVEQAAAQAASKEETETEREICASSSSTTPLDEPPRMRRPGSPSIKGSPTTAPSLHTSAPAMLSLPVLVADTSLTPDAAANRPPALHIPKHRPSPLASTSSANTLSPAAQLDAPRKVSSSGRSKRSGDDLVGMIAEEDREGMSRCVCHCSRL